MQVARVVVGMDGSEPSKQAFRYAQVEARYRGAQLDAVLVYPPPQQRPADSIVDMARDVIGRDQADGRSSPAEMERERARRRGYDQLSAAVKDATEADSEGPAPRLVVLLQEDVVAAITEHSQGADLLVIGLRRRTPVGKLVLGSDARDILLQSPVPVLGVHDAPPK